MIRPISRADGVYFLKSFCVQKCLKLCMDRAAIGGQLRNRRGEYVHGSRYNKPVFFQQARNGMAHYLRHTFIVAQAAYALAYYAIKDLRRPGRACLGQFGVKPPKTLRIVIYIIDKVTRGDVAGEDRWDITRYQIGSSKIIESPSARL